MNINQNYLLIILGIAAIIVEIILGAATGFDLFLLGVILILSGGIGYIANSFSYALISIILLSFIYISFARKLIKQKLTIATKTTNVEGLIGKKGIVVKKITVNQPGQVKMEGEIWRAESENAIGENETVVVKSVSGVTLKVEIAK